MSAPARGNVIVLPPLADARPVCEAGPAARAMPPHPLTMTPKIALKGAYREGIDFSAFRKTNSQALSTGAFEIILAAYQVGVLHSSLSIVFSFCTVPSVEMRFGFLSQAG